MRFLLYTAIFLPSACIGREVFQSLLEDVDGRASGRGGPNGFLGHGCPDATNSLGCLIAVRHYRHFGFIGVGLSREPS